MRRIIRYVLKKRGLQIKKYPDPELNRRMLLMSKLNIDTVLDVGANAGQYASGLRELGYTHRIISFEPLKSAFEKLHNNSININNWSGHNYALGSKDCMNTINIAGNSQSSSILEMLPSLVEIAPYCKYVGEEEIEVKRLDSVFSSFCSDNDKVMLKIDTQGYEKDVIDGASKVLDKISLIQLEVSIIPLYEGEMLFTEMIDHLDKKGFQLVSLENSFWDESTGQLLQVDGLFANKLLLTKSQLH